MFPVRKQVAVGGDGKLKAWGFPYHGLVTDTELTLPNSDIIDTYNLIELTEFNYISGATYYDGWNTTNTYYVKRPGWTLPERSEEQQALDIEEGYNWKPYLTIVGPHRYVCGADGVELGWHKWIYVDGDGQGYIIAVALTRVSASQVSLDFKIVKMKLSVDENPDDNERLIEDVLVTCMVGGAPDIFSEARVGDKYFIMDHTTSGNKVLFGWTLGVFWSTGYDLPNHDGRIDAWNSYLEFVVTGDGLANIDISVNNDPITAWKAATDANTADHIVDWYGSCYWEDGTLHHGTVTTDWTTTFDCTDFDSWSATAEYTTVFDYWGQHTETTTGSLDHGVALGQYTGTIEFCTFSTEADNPSVWNGSCLTPCNGSGCLSFGQHTSDVWHRGGQTHHRAMDFIWGATENYYCFPTVWVNKKTGDNIYGGEIEWHDYGLLNYWEFVAYEPFSGDYDIVSYNYGYGISPPGNLWPAPPVRPQLKFYV